MNTVAACCGRAVLAMLEPYSVIEVRPEWALGNEEMGTKKKFWYHHPSSREAKWLFKFPQQNTGQHWAEKIAAEIAFLLDIPHAWVELGTCEGQRGSVSESFVGDNQNLIHGNQLLKDVLSGYDLGRTFHQSSHTIENIWAVIDRIFVDKIDAPQAKIRIAEYLILDALIGNTDRHHENWGILRELHDNQWRYAVAPSFDHASSLGRELQADRLNLLLSENRVGNYVEKGRGAIFWSAEDCYGPSPLQLVRCAAVSYPDSFRPALRKTERLNRNAVQEAVHRVPDDWMSSSERKFAIELMTYSHEQLGRLGDE